MKKILMFVAIGLLILAACSKKDEEKVNEDSLRLAALQEKYEDASSFQDSLLLLMGDIYAGLDSINMQEGLIYNAGGDNVNRRNEIRENLKSIRERLEMNKALLAEMEAKLSDSDKNNKLYQKTIAEMKARIEAQDAKIEELNAQLASANETITHLSNQVTETQQALAEETQAKEEVEAQYVASENAANTVYYVIGKNKQLKDWGLLTKKFLGATKVMQGDDIDYSVFTKADKRTLTSIPTGAKKVEIKSLNDKASYTIEGEKDEPKTIKITNPELFWQKTPYLIVEIK